MLRVLLGLASFAACGLAQPTYSKEISRIFQARCQQCHREGDIAPFALNDYDAASVWANDIRRVVEARIMPPWKPVPGHGDFRDPLALTDEERQAILDWVDAGAPQGDPAELPEPLPDKGEWALGAPDQVLSMVQPFTPAADGDTYRCFVLPDTFDETRYVSAIDLLPGNRQMVHHVILFLDTRGESPALEGQDGRPGYNCFGGPNIALNLNFSLGGWAPGQRAKLLPEGIGMELPKNARIVMQVHYHPGGRTGEDQTRVGLYFNQTPVQQRLFIVPIFNTNFQIPAGEEAYEVNASFTVLPFLNSKAIWIYPHMHLLGRKINVDLERGDGTVQPMIFEDDWDFNWQGAYTYVEPVAIRSGDTVRLTCTFNNSESNPRNPNNPVIPVGWGEATTDEMCIAFLGVTLDYERFLLPRVNRRR